MYKGETTNNSTGERFYIDKHNVKYVSTTTLIGYYEDKSGLISWYNRLGHEEANRIRDEAAIRGTKVHAYVENYLRSRISELSESNNENNEFDNLNNKVSKKEDLEWSKHLETFSSSSDTEEVLELSPKILELGERAIDYFYKNTTPIRMEEVVFFSDSVTRFAGRFDQLVHVPKDTFYVTGSLYTIPEGYYLVDLKTKNKMPRFDKVDYLVKYLLQGSAYSQALNKIEGIPVNGFILVFVTSKTCKTVYINSETLGFYWNHFYNMLLDYYKVKPLNYGWSDIIREANLVYDSTTLTPMNYIPKEICLT